MYETLSYRLYKQWPPSQLKHGRPWPIHSTYLARPHELAPAHRPYYKPHTIRKQLNSLRSLPHIRYIGQCCDNSGLALRPWHRLRPLIRTHLRGRTPVWYTALKKIVTATDFNDT